MTDRQRTSEYVDNVLSNLLRANTQLVSHITRGAPIDRTLVTKAHAEGKKLINEIRLGEIRVDRWAPPPEEEDEELG